jgi:gliding motility-associated-like protein
MKLKKINHYFSCLFILTLLSPLESWAQKKLIHYWDMNNTLPAGGNAGVSVSPLAAEYSTLGNAFLVYNNTVTTAASCGCTVRDSLVDNGSGGSILNDRHVLGNDTGGTSGGNLYIRTRNPMSNMKFLWYMPTTGYRNILLEYVSELSSVGKPVQNYSYSLDSGLTFITTGLPMTSYTAGIAWGLQSLDLSSIAGANNNPKFVFCISYSGAAAQATSGNDRYDNITLEGDSICPSYTLQPINQSICDGSSTGFLTHVIGGVNNTYQWQVNTGSGFTTINNGGIYSGATSDSLVLTAVNTGMINNQYHCIISSGTCGNITTNNVSLTVKASPTVTVNTATICAGNPTTLSGNGAGTYTWSPSTGLSGSTGASVTANPTVTTTYTISGTNSVSCINTSTTTLTVNPKPIINITGPTVVCSGQSTTYTANGANTYTWTSGPNTPTLTASPTSNTVYTVSGTDLNNCTNIATISVLVKTSPTLTANTETICAGNNTLLTANGANSYTWSPALSLNNSTGASVTASPTATTVYTIIGKAASNGCTSAVTTTVTVNTLPAIIVNSSTICAGATTTLTASGANTYTWNTNSTGTSISPSPTVTTTYTVTGTDGNACINMSTSTVIVNTLPAITVNSSTICAGATTTLTVSGANTYTWSTNLTGASISPSPTITTTYTVSGTDGNSCVSTGTSTITVNTLPIINVNTSTICIGATTTLTASGANTYTWSTNSTGTSISPSPTITTTYTVTGADVNNCKNTGTGTITVNTLPAITVNSSTICAGATTTLTASGANTYTWSTTSTGTSISPSPTVTSTYTVMATDGNNCKNTGTGTITVNNLPTITVNSSTICAGTTTTLTASGANTYTWSTTSTGTSISSSPTVTSTYTVSGTDGNNCMNTGTGTITVNTLPSIAVNSPTICIGTTTTLTASGANTYTWNTNSIGASISPSPTLTTTYTVTGTDGNNCKNTGTGIITVNTLPAITVNSSTICAGATTTLTASGANTYTWSSTSTGASISPSPTVTSTYIVAGTDGNNCMNTGTGKITVNTLPIISVNASTICAGTTTTLTADGAITYTWNTGETGISITPSPTITSTYTVTGTDGNNCSNIGTSTVTVNALPIIKVNTPAICIGATTTLTATGANTYTWNTNSIGASISPSPTLTTTYTVTGTDGNNCVNTAIATILVSSSPTITINSATICKGQSTTLSVNGANTYTWMPATGLSSTTGVSVIANPTITTTYTITGSNGCVNTATTNIIVNQLPVITVKTPTTICVGETASLTASAANTYIWIWNTGATTIAISPSPTVTTTYTVMGTDANNCSNTDTATVKVNELPPVKISGAPVVCTGKSATLMASGATTYTWASGAITTSITISPTTNLTTYSVTGTDINNCVNTATITVTLSYPPTLTINPSKICKGQSTTLTVDGANTYTWGPTTGLSSTTGASVVANPTVTTTYTITGYNGCVNTITTSIMVDSLPNITITGTTLFVCSGKTTTLTASGANTYVWSTGSNAATDTISPTVNTTYTVIGTNANNCTNTAIKTVTVNPLPDISINQGTSLLTIISGTSITLVASGANTYQWVSENVSCTTCASITESPNATTQYCVMGMDNNKCTDTSCVTITIEETCGNVFIPDAFSPNGDGSNETFKVYGKCINALTLQIFDRWGNKIFETTDIAMGWDGTFQGNMMNTGTYIYQAAYTLSNGEKDKAKGNFILMR